LKARKGTPGGGGTMATPVEKVPAGTVATTAFVAVSITETFSEPSLAT
jgi:hypothetical protein